MPAGRTFFSSKKCSSGLNANLFRLPLGVSMTTRKSCLWSESRGFRRDGSAIPFFLLILDLRFSAKSSATLHSLQRRKDAERKGRVCYERQVSRVAGNKKRGTLAEYLNATATACLRLRTLRRANQHLLFFWREVVVTSRGEPLLPGLGRHGAKSLNCVSNDRAQP